MKTKHWYLLAALLLISMGLIRSTDAQTAADLPSPDNHSVGATDRLAPGTIIVDHTCTDLSQIPAYWIEQAKTVAIHYAHTSHGSQINSGLETLDDATYDFSRMTAGAEPPAALSCDPGALCMYDGNPPETYIEPEDYWSTADGISRTTAVADTGLFDYSMWSWCGQQSDNPTTTVQLYLDRMAGFEAAYPDMRFILMTGHTDGGSATLQRNNDLVRQYALENGMALFDFADIETYDPLGGGPYVNNSEGTCAWCVDFCSAHPAYCTDLPDACTHSETHPEDALFCKLKGNAFWWMMARLAGWDGTTAPQLHLTAPDGGESWPIGAQQEIRWTSTGTLTHVSLAYSTDGFATAPITITSSTLNDGSYTWTIPDDPSKTARVRVASVVSPATVYDDSDADFTIYSATGQQTLVFQDGVSPNAGYAGTADAILASDADANANLGGAENLETFYGDAEVRRSLLRWDLATLPSGITVHAAAVSLYRYDGAAENDMTVALYRVTREWIEGSGYDLWPDPSYVPDGATWLTATLTTPWTTPGGDYAPTPVGQTTIPTSIDAAWVNVDATSAVQAWADGAANDGLLLRPSSGEYTYHYFHSSEALTPTLRPRLTVTYTVDAEPAPELILTAPTAGVSWPISSARQIQWTTQRTVTQVNLYYSLDGVTTTIDTHVPNSGGYAWTTPPTPTTDARVRVESAVSPTTVYDVSGAFTLYTPTEPGEYTVYLPLVLRDYGAAAPSCSVPLTGVTISGPTSGSLVMHTFTAIPAPANATLPLAYQWTPEPAAGQGSATVSYLWATTGTKTITLTASNCAAAHTANDSHAITIQAAPSGDLIQPADLTYLGAFAYPEGDEWAYGARALAYYPDGDPGSTDDHPGSLYATGLDQNDFVGEITIPDPVISDNFDDLPKASVLQPLADITGGWKDNCTYEVDCLYRELDGLAYLPNVQGTTKIVWNLRDWYNTTGYDQDSLGWSNLDMTGAQGVWHIGDRPSPDNLFHNSKTCNYLFQAPTGFANEHLEGKWLIAGNHREAGAYGGSQGPTMYALAPWEDGNPPTSGQTLDALALLYYTEVVECVWEAEGDINEHPAPGVCHFPDYRAMDNWEGGVWVETASKRGILIFGRKGLGDNCYGPTTLCGDDPCAPSSGYHAYPYEPRILFYNPEDLEEVLAGTQEPWEVLPYETYNPEDVVIGGECNFLGAAAYDRERNFVYVTEREAGPFGETAVHAWQVQ